MSEPELIPFGKYRGMPVDAVLEDRQYAEWLMTQGWFRERYQNLYITIQSGGAQSDMTPEHNRMQARFLDEEYTKKFVALFSGKIKFTTALSVSADRIKFEADGWDVLIPVGVTEMCRVGYSDPPKMEEFRDTKWIFVELKPTISDDFPAVLRQVKSRKYCGSGPQVVLCDTFDTHSAVPFESVKKMFASSGIILLLSSEFE